MFWSNAFSTVLEMTVAGSLVICAVVLLRLILKRAPRVFSYALWLVVLFRLLCPVAPEAAVGVPGGADAMQEIAARVPPAYADGDAEPARGMSGENAVRGGAANRPEQAGEADAPGHGLREFGADLIADVGLYVWLVGAGVMLLRAAAQYVRLRRRLVGAVALQGGVWQADHIDTPFVLGLLRPRIYLPSATGESERDYVVAHERRHIRRGDPIWRLLAFAALCVHWFNPLVWLAFALSRRDMELSCDEAVLREMGRDIRADYAESLLRFTTGNRQLVGAPLAFGESDTKERIVHTMKYKKPALWVSAVAALLCVGAVTVLAFNAKQEEEQEPPAAVNGVTNNEPSGAVNGKTDGETDGETADGTGGERLSVIRWWDADLDGDGTPEQIILDKGELEGVSVTTPWIMSSKGEKLCELRYVGTPHVGWGTSALLERNGRTYLFEYSPYMSTGIAGYQYWISSLDAETGELVLEEEKEAVFPVWEPMTDEEIDAVVEFVNAANELWPHCRLLFSTDPEFARGLTWEDGSVYAGDVPVICGSGDDLRYVETLPWMIDELIEAGEFKEDMSLREQLAAYREIAEQRHAEYLKTAG